MEVVRIIEKVLSPLLHLKTDPGAQKQIGHEEEHLALLSRSELLTREQLADKAELLAVGHSARHDRRTGKVLFKRFSTQALFLRRAYFTLAEAARNNEPLTPGAEWLLDNNHVIGEHIQSIKSHMPRGYYRTLPKLIEGMYQGYPRVYHLALQYIGNTDGVVEADLLACFVEAYQRRQVLTIGELWAVPAMLRLALIERITVLTEVNLRARQERVLADQLRERVLEDETLVGTELLQRVIQLCDGDSTVLEAGAVPLLQELRIRGRPALLAVQWLEERLRELGIDPAEGVREAQKIQVGNQISIANSVTSLNSVSAINWKEWFEALSHVDMILRNDPSGIYSRSDFITRDRCRKVIEILALKLKRSEVDIAQECVVVAGTSAAEVPGGDSVLYFTIDDGLPSFEKLISFTPDMQTRVRRLCKEYSGILYFGSVFLCWIFLEYVIWLLCFGATSFVLYPILLLWAIPASECALRIVQWLATQFVTPTRLPKLDFENGIATDCRTIVAVHALFDSKDAILRAVDALHVRYLGNQDEKLQFVILGDFWPAKTDSTPYDEELLTFARAAIEQLNAQYGRLTFHILFRKRVWCETESEFMGWERKRGKVVEFNKLLLGSEDTTFIISEESKRALRGSRYVITLDADAQLPPSSAHKMVGAIAHPLNAPVVDETKKLVTRGYAVIQPRVCISLPSTQASMYAAAHAGEVGLDPYTSACSDVYQDVFDAGLYLGKGIYEIETFEKVLSDRVPEGALLSHDLFEGVFAGVGYASDINVIDDIPSKYNSHAMRYHRWVRGDWQLLPWLFSQVPDTAGGLHKNPLSILSRWKIFDNLRRSLVPPFQFLAIASSLIFLELPLAASLLLVLVFFYCFPVFTVLFSSLIGLQSGYSLRAYAAKTVTRLTRTASEAMLQIVWLPFETYLMLDAIFTTLYRLYVSKKHLLEWQTADFSERTLGKGLMTFIKQLAPGLILTTVVLILIALYAPANLLLSIPLILLWFSAPFIAAYTSSPFKPPLSYLADTDQAYLRQIAWDTWLFFDEHITPENNYLIPDNVQEVPEVLVANRTSPTNIGLSLMAVYSAYDFGFIPLTSVFDRCATIVTTISRLERYRGHLFNWYEIDTLRVLNPRYISFVDSGNLIAFLMAVQSGLKNAWFEPLLRRRHFTHIEHWLDNKPFLWREMSGEAGSAFRELKQTLAHSSDGFDGLFELLEGLSRISSIEWNNPIDELSVSREVAHRTLQRFQKVSKQYDDISELFQWFPYWRRLAGILEDEAGGLEDGGESTIRRIKTVKRILQSRSPSLSLLSKIIRRVQRLAEGVQEHFTGKNDLIVVTLISELLIHLSRAQKTIEQLRQKRESLQSQIETIINETDFTFLYDSKKELFYIGYNADEARLDASRYDLLASEARLGSFVTIVLGQVRDEHWMKLRRAFARSYGQLVLLSWSGTMFEYLMPLLVTRGYRGTLLDVGHRSAVKAQRAYGRKRSAPWGVSESGYSGVDFQKNYQYKAFGVPGLGLKRGLADDLVVSPYATALAILVEPRNAVQNLRLLEAEGARGSYGFYEAIDYTAERLSEDEDKSIVQSFFAHHQGMAFVAINNILHNNIFQERFHADPRVKAFDTLLHEKFPDWVATIPPHQAEVSYLELQQEDERSRKSEYISSPHTRIPITRVLSNGHYSLFIDNAGSGRSFLSGNIAINRWREDPAINSDGMYIYARDVETNKVWSTAYQPTQVEPDTYEVIFNPDKVEFKRSDSGIRLHTEIVVSPEEPLEIRRVTVTNTTAVDKEIELTSYFEVSLCQVAADSAHPAFMKMFIESEFVSQYDALIFKRRPRSTNEKSLYAFHLVTMPICWSPTQYETARTAFIGRGRTARIPIALQSEKELSGTTGLILDPIASLRSRLEVKSGSSATVCFVTGYAEDRTYCDHLMHLYHDLHSIHRSFEMAWSQSNVELRHAQYSIAQTHIFQKLANCIIHSVPAMRGNKESLERNTVTQSGFWRFGISGDMPIVLLRLNDPAQLKVARELLVAHEYLRLRGIRFDTILFNEYPGGYYQDFQGELEALIHSGSAASLVDKPGGVFLRNRTQVSDEEVRLMESVARVVLEGRKGLLAQQIEIDTTLVSPISVRRGLFNYLTDNEDHYEPFAPPALQGLFNNGIGAFSSDGKNYHMHISGDSRPPMPWSNVIANKDFGFLVTESGAGYTWARNSRENRITPWSNDPTTDPLGEVIYIRDSDTGAYWCPTPGPISNPGAVAVRHGFGLSEFQTQQKGIFSKLTISGATEESVKWYSLHLTNGDYVPRNLEIYFYVEWVLGVSRYDSYRFHVSQFLKNENCLQVVNRYNNEFSDGVAFIGSNCTINSFTADRVEFLGRNRDRSMPYFLERRILSTLKNLIKSPRSRDKLSGTLTPLGDTCGVISVKIELQPRQERDVLFYIGYVDEESEVSESALAFAQLKERQRSFGSVQQFWKNTTDSIQVFSPEDSFNVIMNGWLQYQNLSCRIWGRSAFYQSGGAYGFRDQLQDSLALLYTRPDYVRDQILLHASRQFVEGDVQHWWHPPTGRGVRTRISDDYLWLPYVVEKYIEVTGDRKILDERISFIEGPHLEPGHMESYIVPEQSSHTGTLYEHCVIALDRAISFGPHGLPLIGCGDWNDGMNEVGIHGKGESVWLGWFLFELLNKFAPIVESRNDQYRSGLYRKKSSELIHAIEQHAWDGKWYLRAFFDDGTPLGSSTNDECRIDSLSQSWSVITGGGDSERARQALESVYTHLVKKESKIIKLLDPPFDKGTLNPGYIKGYLPGVRENGGQYTHAATWVIMATAMAGMGTRAFELFQLINPINHGATAAAVQQYQGEPYVTCGDVYSVPPHVGRAGWSWYTGSGAWLYRVGLEFIAGLQVRSTYFFVAPCIPSAWQEFSINYTRGLTTYVITIKNPNGVERGVVKTTVNGVMNDSHHIMFEANGARDTRTVFVEILMG